MSIKVMTWYWEHSKQEGHKLLALLALSDWCTDDGECFPGIKALAKRIRRDERSAQRVVSELEKSGELVVYPGMGKGSEGRRSPLYYLVKYRETHGIKIEPMIIEAALRYRQLDRKNGRKGLEVRKAQAALTGDTDVTPTGDTDVTLIRHIDPSLDPSVSDQGVDRAKSAPSTPTPPATPKTPRLPNDGYEIPNPPTNGHTKKYAKVTSDYYDPRRLVNGYIPEGEGINAIEVYHEWVAPSARRLSHPNQRDIVKKITDLERWRTAVQAWIQAGHRAEDVGGMLDWYHHPERLPSVKFGKPTNGATKAQSEMTFKQWMLNTYHSTFASTIKPESELRDEYRQWRKANGLPPAG